MPLFTCFSCIIAYNIFKPIFIANEIVIPYGLNPFDICQDNPVFWHYIKISFVILYLLSSIIISNFFNNIIFKFLKKIPFNKIKKYLKKLAIKKVRKKTNPIKSNKQINILIGENENNEKIFITEKGLYQNILVTRHNRIW